MHLPIDDIPVRLTAPGATARHLPDFGTASGALAAEYFTLAAGTDIAPLLAGLADDCARRRTGATWSRAGWSSPTATAPPSTCAAARLFYWPPGHSVRVEEDAEVVMFSPQVEHGEVMDHMGDRLAGIG